MQNLEEKSTKKLQLQNLIKFVVHDSEMSLCLAHLSQMLLKRANSRGLVHSSKIRMCPLNNLSISGDENSTRLLVITIEI